MSLNIEQKKALVTEVNEVARTAQSVVAAEYRGLSVTQITNLRAQARKSGVYVRVVKNTLARKAVAGTSYECIAPQLKGPLILAFSKEDPGAAARVIKAFAKDNDKFTAPDIEFGKRQSSNFFAPACDSGLDPDVSDAVLSAENVNEFLTRYTNLFETIARGYLQEGKKYITLAIGCTGGKHRSVAIAEELAKRLDGLKIADEQSVLAHAIHRDLGRER